ncbi:MAG: LacI family DNA-binding transcriptional regulator [Prolixibacteraceae bacterium]|nr:LacI family DNA-binding transcriptional regulator [Prolixibacteraceae bacterium]
MEKETTIYDIAKELGLSASTVSRALKGNTIINARTRAKVEECAQKMGYRSNAFASNLRTRRTNTIGVIVPRLDSNFMSACLAGMENVASKNGYNLIISQSHESVEKEAQNAITMFNSRVDGLIVSLTVEHSDLAYFNQFAQKKVPVVYFDRVPGNTPFACFVTNNEKAAYEATKHLISQNCARLLHVTVDSQINVYADRKKGFERAVAESKNCSGSIIYAASLTFDEGEKIALEIAAMKNQPDGIFVANDLVASGCMLQLQKSGFQIPDDIAIVGFNNDPISNIVSPKLSTVNYPGREAGILAANSLVEQLKNENTALKSQRVVLESEFIIRESSLRST